MIKKNFTGSIDIEMVGAIFDRLPGCLFFIKDRNLNYVAVNGAMMVLCRVKKKKDILGRSSSDFFPLHLSARYDAMDRKILQTGQPVLDRLEMGDADMAEQTWLFFSRFPLMDCSGKTLGVIGVARQFNPTSSEQRRFKRLGKVIRHIQKNFFRPLNLRYLADFAGVSRSQIERDFKALSGLTLQQYLHQLRMEYALKLLVKRGAVTDIAYRCGYTDHSAFSRRFKLTMGITPSEFRKRHLPA